MIIIFILVIIVGLYFVLSSNNYNEESMLDKSDYSQNYIIPMQNRELRRRNIDYTNTTQSTPCRPSPVAQPVAVCNPPSVTPCNAYSNVPIISNYTYQRRPNPIIIDVIGGNKQSKKSNRTRNKNESKIK